MALPAPLIARLDEIRADTKTAMDASFRRYCFDVARLHVAAARRPGANHPHRLAEVGRYRRLAAEVLTAGRREAA